VIVLAFLWVGFAVVTVIAFFAILVTAATRKGSSTSFMRYLIGMVMAETGGSPLAAGVPHSSFNASAALSMLSGGWQYVPAMMVLTVLMAANRRWVGPQSTSRPSAWA
jgi:hypothetical protein